jgi:hypothetical protein
VKVSDEKIKTFVLDAVETFQEYFLRIFSYLKNINIMKSLLLFLTQENEYLK